MKLARDNKDRMKQEIDKKEIKESFVVYKAKRMHDYFCSISRKYNATRGRRNKKTHK